MKRRGINRRPWIPVLSLITILAACDSDAIRDSKDPIEHEPLPPGVLEAILEADSTLGPPGYVATLRSACTTNGGSATIEEARLAGPFADSPGYLVRETGRTEVVDTMSLAIRRPGRVLLTCVSSIGERAFAQLDFDGFVPEMNLDPLHATLTRVEEETIIDLTDYIRWADNVGVEPPHPAYEMDVEIDRNEERTLLRVRPRKENGTFTLEVHAGNAFGSVQDNLLLNITYPPGLVMHSVDWMTGNALPTRVEALDESGQTLAVDTLATGNGFFDFREFDAPMAGLRIEAEGYFTRVMPFMPDNADRRTDLTLPVLPKASCLETFSDAPDPEAACLDVTRQMLFQPLDPFSLLEGYRMWPWSPGGGMLYSHATSGATLPAAWAVAARESAARWRDLGITMASAGRFSADVSGATAARDVSGRWTTNVRGIQLFVPDNHDDAELAIYFREGSEGLHSAVIALPVLESVDAWFSRFEAIRLRAQLAVGTSSAFEFWEPVRQNRFLTDWIIPIRARDRSPYQHDNLGRGGFETGTRFEDAFPDTR